MASTFYSVYLHILFSTKNRVRALAREFRLALFAYLGGATRGEHCEPIIVGGHADHAHLLLRAKPELSIPEFVKEIKRSSGAWIRRKISGQNEFRWQAGYGVFSVSYWDVDKLRAYIADQERHHRAMTWETELEKLLAKHGVEFDRRYFLG